MIRRIGIAFLFCQLCVLLRAQPVDYAIDWFTIDAGGGTSADAVYAVSGTIGQPDPGLLSDNVFSIVGGFWAASLTLNDPPPLNIAQVGTNMVFSWSAAATGYFLEQFSDQFGWTQVTQPIVVTNGQNTVTVPMSQAAAYYRLTTTPTPPPPRLSIEKLGANVRMTWPTNATGYYLEHSFDSSRPNTFAALDAPVIVSNGVNTVTVPALRRMSQFRLSRAAKGTSLSITRIGNNVVLAWPATATGLLLEENLSANQPEGWAPVRIPVVLSNAQNTVTVPISGAMAYFRLTTTPSSLFLKIARTGTNVVVSWPAAAAGFALEQTLDVTQPNAWSLVGLPVVEVNGRSTVTMPASASGSYFRLNDHPAPPQMKVTIVGTNAVISWTAPSTGFYLENSADGINWLYVPTPIVVSNGLNTVTVPLVDFATYYRLTQTPHGPPLRVEYLGTDILLSWPAPSTRYFLQRAGGMTSPWVNVPRPPIVVGGRNEITIPVIPGTALFRLQYQ
jgi:hypothetical protein